VLRGVWQQLITTGQLPAIVKAEVLPPGLTSPRSTKLLSGAMPRRAGGKAAAHQNERALPVVAPQPRLQLASS
jgi:hypothetical protein